MNTATHNFTSARVLVVGDLILDRYWSGATERISPEAPVPVVHVQKEEERPGGAGNVALNVAALGGEVSLIGITGNDDNADRLQGLLEQQSVSCRFQKQSGINTITKLRILSQHQQLIRLDFEETQPVVDYEALSVNYQTALAGAGVIILSDYAKGTLMQIETLIEQARQAQIPVLVDPKGSDFERYRGATVITPNLREFESVVGPCATVDEVVSKGKALCEKLDLKALLVTRSEHGMSLISVDEDVVHLPAKAREVFDVTGAGDTVIAVLATALASGSSLLQATALANAAASLVVGKLGAATVSAEELNAALHEVPPDAAGVMTEAELVAAVRAAKLRGESVVMTNGCFDILHAGHVRYLREARVLGDRLILAVNDDASVSRLKGDSRPINSLSTRMEVLSALESVDWVVAFSEDTPARLIGDVLPDVLVKGGDYTPDQIAGGVAVQENGGRVIVLDYHDNHSTTAIIDAAREQAQMQEKDS